MYDWIWRREGKPMTFEHIFREGVEICSAELYVRWTVATTLVSEMYQCGLLPSPREQQRNRSDEYRVWQRLLKQALVRAYLVERRAGTLPREPGVPAGTDERMREASAAVEREYRRERQRVKPFALPKMTAGKLAEALKEFDPDDTISIRDRDYIAVIGKRSGLCRAWISPNGRVTRAEDYADVPSDLYEKRSG